MNKTEPQEEIYFSDFKIDDTGTNMFGKAITHLPTGNKYNISRNEFRVLEILVKANGIECSRSGIAKQVWGQDTYYIRRSMDVVLSKLRKLTKDDDKVKIINIHGEGYKLMVTTLQKRTFEMKPQE